MARKIRPELKPGDVCTFSKRYLRHRPAHIRKRLSQMRLVVLHIASGNGVDRYSRIKCAMTDPAKTRKKTTTHVVDRQNLWFTGYNTSDKKGHRTVSKSHATKKATRSECVCPYEVWMGQGCKCGAAVPYVIPR